MVGQGPSTGSAAKVTEEMSSNSMTNMSWAYQELGQLPNCIVVVNKNKVHWKNEDADDRCIFESKLIFELLDFFEHVSLAKSFLVAAKLERQCQMVVLGGIVRTCQACYWRWEGL